MMTRPLRLHPPGWDVFSLEPDSKAGYVLEAASGSTPDTEDLESWGGTIPWLTPKEITDSLSSRFIGATERALTQHGLTKAGRLWPPLTVMLSKRAPVGIPVINTVAMATNQGFLNFRCGERLSEQFLYYWFLANGPYLDAVANGSTYPELYVGDLFELEVAAPSRSEQDAIVSVLAALDDKIAVNRRMNETLRSIIQAIFKSWFVDFEPLSESSDGSAADMPDAVAALFPRTLVDSELGPIPKGWKVGTIASLTSKIQYGFTQSASSSPVGPRFLRITDIQGGLVDWGRVPYCEASPDEHRRYSLKPHDVLVARTGASTGENIYLPAVPDAVFASYLVRFQFATPALARFVGAFMRTRAYFEFVSGTTGGSAQPNASAQVLAEARLAVPPDPLLAAFLNAVVRLDARIAENSGEVATLSALRDHILPRIISGKLKVRDAGSLVEKAV